MKLSCPNCQLPMHRAIQNVTFAAGSGPVFALEMQVAAEWCSRPGCHQRVQGYNSHDHQSSDFTDAVARVRDSLEPIAEGEIERGKPISQYDFTPGMRKTKLKDAREIAKRAIEKLNVAINKFNDGIFE